MVLVAKNRRHNKVSCKGPFAKNSVYTRHNPGQQTRRGGGNIDVLSSGLVRACFDTASVIPEHASNNIRTCIEQQGPKSS